MNAIEKQAAEAACMRVLNEYTVATDTNNAAMWLGVFTDDALWEFGNLRFEGRAQLEKFYANRTNGKTSLVRHISCNELVTVVDAERATAISTMLVFRQLDYSGSGPGVLKGASAILQNDDEFVRSDGRWKIKKRLTITAFVAP